MKNVLRLICVLAFGILNACSACNTEPDRLPDEAKYNEDALLLVNTSQKLANENDVKKLHTLAMALQTTRTLACIDFNNECSLFGKYLSFAIEVSKKGTLTPAERGQLREMANDIRLAVDEGKRKLRNAWEKRQPKK